MCEQLNSIYVLGSINICTLTNYFYFSCLSLYSGLALTDQYSKCRLSAFICGYLHQNQVNSIEIIAHFICNYRGNLTTGQSGVITSVLHLSFILHMKSKELSLPVKYSHP